LNFFLGNDQKSDDHDSDDDEDPDERRQREKNELKIPTARDIMVRFQTGQKGAKNKRKKKKMMKRIAKKSNKGKVANLLSFSCSFLERALSSAQLFLKITLLRSAQLFWTGFQLSSATFFPRSARSAQLRYFFQNLQL
jgi:hypothetical protein